MLRLLFDQAYAMRPSIIFFDEVGRPISRINLIPPTATPSSHLSPVPNQIDGLAPVRTSRQEQNYSSIVSTLLALMDGLDSRGDVVVIGATVLFFHEPQS